MIEVEVGGCSREALRARLAARGIQLNAHAETLLADAAFDEAAEPQRVAITLRTVAELGFPDGARLSQIFAAADALGLRRCPPVTGPYLRLAWTAQASAPDSVLSAGRAPSGSIHVISAPLRDDDEYPKGFYLRVVDGRPWLRGYRCEDEHVWSPGDVLALRDSPVE